MGLLSDKPASLIKHIQLYNDSYEEARGKLMDRYDKKKKIIHALIKTFLDQKSISQANLTSLRNIVDTSDEVLRGLKALGNEETSRDPWLIQLFLQKLSTETRRLWSVKTSDVEFPSWEEFLEFLNTRSSSLELMVYDESDTKISTKSNFVAFKNIQGYKLDENCFKCSGMHKLFKCIKFKNMDLNARKNFVKHPKRNVKQPVKQTTESIGQREEMLCNESSTLQMPIISSTSLSKSQCISFISTAKILLYNKEGDFFLFRALLDSGSESSIVSENVINILGLKRKIDSLSLSGISRVPTGITRTSVVLKIGSRFNEELITVNAYILNKVTSQIPIVNIDIKELDYLKGIPPSDEDFSRPSECDIIFQI
ncbi:uncharacterized protein NPIL_242141 [Nephila pilipes]|uniref:Peptidase A2 domain-containing protein n=1 Tax=Nephila pilipes TaxID=299642 RepID=A0A8X6PR12_NEPPI|nr:uncharacterized protein NPIL_242141 [Nephila pilipes]